MRFAQKSVVVVGGGFSGTLAAAQLLRRAPKLSMAVIDRNHIPGRGLAYGTEHDCHLLNVPAADMSAFPAEPDHFLNWAAQHCAHSPVHRCSFLPRSFYGRYLGSLLDENSPSQHKNFEWIRDEALSLRREAGGFLIERKQGTPLRAQVVVLALGNFPPGNLGVSGLGQDCRRYLRHAWSRTALAELSEGDDVLLIGSGLTSVDLAIALQSKGFKGKIHMLSRHGLIPHGHQTTSRWPGFWTDHAPRTTRGLLRLIKDQVRAASASGNDWRAVIDSLRPQIQKIWQSLPLKERRRFLRHARAYWEVHRHRVAPEIARLFSRMIESGQVHIHAGRVTRYGEGDHAAEVAFRSRSTGTSQTLRVARVINCSGPETDCRKIDDPFLSSLFEQNLVRQDALALGLDVDTNGALLGLDGIPAPGLLAIGPARKGLLWESTAVPELRVQAEHLANHILTRALADESEAMPAESLSTT